MRRVTATVSYWVGIVLLGVVLALAALQVGLGRGPTGAWQTSPPGAWKAAYGDEDPCWDYGDCDSSGGRGGESGGHQGYGGGGGRSGDYDGGPGDDCRNACGNTIIVPMPGQGR